jgi:hypothetical protein
VIFPTEKAVGQKKKGKNEHEHGVVDSPRRVEAQQDKGDLIHIFYI